MAELIDLTSDDFPECESCNEPTKRIVGKTFDIDGPGKVGTMYDCDNRACNALKLAKIRAWNAEFLDGGKDKLDARLREICGEHFAPLDERYK